MQWETPRLANKHACFGFFGFFLTVSHTHSASLEWDFANIIIFSEYYYISFSIFLPVCFNEGILLQKGIINIKCLIQNQSLNLQRRSMVIHLLNVDYALLNWMHHRFALK